MYWRYEAGDEYLTNILSRNLVSGACFDAGWHCWAFPDNDSEFVTWMSEHMVGYYECDWRFNSGDVMYTVLIQSNEDATIFKLRWM